MVRSRWTGTRYGEEVKHLESKYGIPDGRLYLAYCDEGLAGCIGLRKIDNRNCENEKDVMIFGGGI